MKATHIKWLDAAGTSENIWQRHDTLPEDLIEVESAGIIISEDSDRITIVMSRTEYSFMGDLTIPKISIISRKDFDA